ncbi:hypothetical protein Ctob_009700, partial [Chrysochromulina tobinii]
MAPASAIEASDADESPASAASAVADLADACRVPETAGVPDGCPRPTVRLEPFQEEEEMVISEEVTISEETAVSEEMTISEEGIASEEAMVGTEDKMIVAEADTAQPEPAATPTVKVEEVPSSSAVEEVPGSSAGDGDSAADEVLLVSMHGDEDDDETTAEEAPAFEPATAKTMWGDGAV